MKQDELVFTTARAAKQISVSKGKAVAVFVRVYFLALIALMFGLYFYVLAVCVGTRNPALVVRAAVCVIPVAAVSAVFVVTAFGLWGKLLGRIFHRSSKAIEKAMLPPDAAPERQDELYLYRDTLRLVYKSGDVLIPFSELERAEYRKIGGDYWFIFHATKYMYYAHFPVKKLPMKKFQKLMPCPVVQILSESAPEEQGEKKPRKVRPAWLNKDTIGGTVMGCVAIGAGVALTVMHYKVSEHMPVFLGVFFALGGLLVVFGVFGNGKKWCNEIAVPLLFGLMMIVFGTGFFPALITELKLNTVLDVLVSQPYAVCMFGFAGVGLFMVLLAVINAIKLIRGKL